MKGPMDSAIEPDPAGQGGGGKARKRLDEFIEQRYPGGIPPASSPLGDRPSAEPSEPAKRPAKPKRPKKRKRS